MGSLGRFSGRFGPLWPDSDPTGKASHLEEGLAQLEGSLRGTFKEVQDVFRRDCQFREGFRRQGIGVNVVGTTMGKSFGDHEDQFWGILIVASHTPLHPQIKAVIAMAVAIAIRDPI
jgi:hypothetical protein